MAKEHISSFPTAFRRSLVATAIKQSWTVGTPPPIHLIPKIVAAYQTDIGMKPGPFIESLGLFPELTGTGCYRYGFESGGMHFILKPSKKLRAMLRKRSSASYARATTNLLEVVSQVNKKVGEDLIGLSEDLEAHLDLKWENGKSLVVTPSFRCLFHRLPVDFPSDLRATAVARYREDGSYYQHDDVMSEDRQAVLGLCLQLYDRGEAALTYASDLLKVRRIAERYGIQEYVLAGIDRLQRGAGRESADIFSSTPGMTPIAATVNYEDIVGGSAGVDLVAPPIRGFATKAETVKAVLAAGWELRETRKCLRRKFGDRVIFLVSVSRLLP